MEIALGNGCVMVGTVNRDGRKGIMLKQTCEPHDINSREVGYTPGEQYIPTDKDVIIWIDNIDGLRVLENRLKILSLEMDGYIIVDSSIVYP